MKEGSASKRLLFALQRISIVETPKRIDLVPGLEQISRQFPLQDYPSFCVSRALGEITALTSSLNSARHVSETQRNAAKITGAESCILPTLKLDPEG